MSSTEQKQTTYLNREQIHSLLGEPHVHGFALVSTDLYNEEKIAEKIKSFGQEARDILFEATLNNAIIGYGQKNFGVVKIEDKYLEIHDIYRDYGVLMNNPAGSTLGEDDLTPNRLMRFFRYDISDWIQKNKQGSYLWRKYSRRDPDMMSTCFRGAEYLEDLTPLQADYLIDTVLNMDRVLGTSVVDRVIRAFDARGQQYTFILPARGVDVPKEQMPRTMHQGVIREHPVEQPMTTEGKDSSQTGQSREIPQTGQGKEQPQSGQWKGTRQTGQGKESTKTTQVKGAPQTGQGKESSQTTQGKDSSQSTQAKGKEAQGQFKTKQQEVE